MEENGVLYPVYYGTGLSLNISETDNSLDLELAREVARFFRVADARAASIIEETQKVVKRWKKLADKYKISSKEKDLMAAAFTVSETR